MTEILYHRSGRGQLDSFTPNSPAVFGRVVRWETAVIGFWFFHRRRMENYVRDGDLAALITD